jgi:hypothetical protein
MANTESGPSIGDAVTPEMIAAAVKVIAEDYGVCSEYVAEGLVADMFKAMMAVRISAGQSMYRDQTDSDQINRGPA